MMTSQEMNHFTSQLLDRLFTGQAQQLEIENLLKAGAQINFKCEDNLQTPLMAALEFGNSLDIIKLLIKHKADVNAVDIQGRTPLFYALKFYQKLSDLPVIEELIKNGANLKVQSLNPRKETPLMYALRYRVDHGDILQLLIDSGDDVNAVDIQGKTPLFYALRYYQSLPLIQFLVNNGARVNVSDNQNVSVLEYAVRRGASQDIFDYLEEENEKIAREVYIKRNNQQVSNWIDDLLMSNPAYPAEQIITETLSEEEEKAMEEYDNFLIDNALIDR